MSMLLKLLKFLMPDFTVKPFLAHLSWKLKWAFLIACCPSSVRLSVCPFVCKLYTFSSSSQEPIGQFQPKLGTKHPYVMGIQVCSNEVPRPFPRGDNNEIAKMHWWTLKIFVLRTTGPISPKLGTKHTWVMAKNVFSNERPCPFQRGDNSENILTKHPWVMDGDLTLNE